LNFASLSKATGQFKLETTRRMIQNVGRMRKQNLHWYSDGNQALARPFETL